jgi:hypothetical protein
MESLEKVSIENIIGRITHGLIGMDIFITEKKENEYLKDFLTLDENEIKDAFLSTSAQKRLIPVGEVRLSNDEVRFLDCIKRAQRLVARIGTNNVDNEVEDCIIELGSKMDIIYAAVPEM